MGQTTKETCRGNEEKKKVEKGETAQTKAVEEMRENGKQSLKCDE